MNTTHDLPDDLVRAVEFQATQNGRKLSDTGADLLRKGLAISSIPQSLAPPNGSARIDTEPTTGLPVIVCDPHVPAGNMTISELLALEHVTQTREDLERLGISS